MIRFPWALSVSIGSSVVIGVGSAVGQETAVVLERYSFEEGPTVRVELSDELSEISGLALTPDGRLLGHHDERAILYELDRTSGEILWRSALGRRGIRGDFEGLAFADDRGFLVLSDGSLVEFEPEAGAERFPFQRIRTGFRNRCEVEGLAHDRATRALLMACKTPRERALRGHLVVFAFGLDTMTLEAEPRVFLPVESIPGFDADDQLSPSGIDVDPATGHLVVVAARERRILEFSPDGRLLDVRDLSRSAHRQAEGIAIDPDGSILIADEAAGDAPALSRYEPRGTDAR